MHGWSGAECSETERGETEESFRTSFRTLSSNALWAEQARRALSVSKRFSEQEKTFFLSDPVHINARDEVEQGVAEQSMVDPESFSE